jgi:di/tricarboxylate transporter
MSDVKKAVSQTALAAIGWPDLLSCGGALAVALLPPPDGETPMMMRAIGLMIFTIGYWATGRMAEHLVALVFFLLAMLIALAPANVVFSGFAAPAFWLMVGGLLIGGAVDRTGLGQHLARAVIGGAVRSYGKIIAAILVIDVALAFIMPSTMGRVALLLPIAKGIADNAGFRPGDRGWSGIILAVVFGSYLAPTTILPANVPNNVLLGAAETVHGVALTYFDYLLLHFPILGLLKTLVLGVVIVRFWPDRPVPKPQEDGPQEPWSPAEYRLLLLLILALSFWMTDVWHGILPAWVSLTAGLLCLAPRLGVIAASDLDGLLKLRPLIYIAGIFGLGAVVASTGLGAFLAEALLDIFPVSAGADAINFMFLALGTTVLGMLTTMPSVPAIMAPLAGELASAMGLPVKSVLMATVLGFSTVFFPYQVPPLLLGLYLGHVPLREGARLGMLMGAITIVVLFPMDFLWWQWLGYLP